MGPQKRLVLGREGAAVTVKGQTKVPASEEGSFPGFGPETVLPVEVPLLAPVEKDHLGVGRGHGRFRGQDRGIFLPLAAELPRGLEELKKFGRGLFFLFTHTDADQMPSPPEADLTAATECRLENAKTPRKRRRFSLCLSEFSADLL
jgi:hypothetical protein